MYRAVSRVLVWRRTEKKGKIWKKERSRARAKIGAGKTTSENISTTDSQRYLIAIPDETFDFF